MKKHLPYRITLLTVILLSTSHIFAQTSHDPAKTYIFKDSPKITKVGSDYVKVSDDKNVPNLAPIGARFRVIDIIEDGSHKITDIIIQFLYYDQSSSSESYLEYNVIESAASLVSYNSYLTRDLTPKQESDYRIDYLEKLPDAYFKVDIESYNSSVIEYSWHRNLHFAYGTVSYLARVRPRTQDVASRWFTDLNLGAAFGARYDMPNNWSAALLGGIGIARVTVDKNSVRNLTIDNPVEKSSIVFSGNILMSYKMLSFGVAFGMDWLSYDGTPESQAWIYNKKLFYGLTLGFNVFRSDSANIPANGQSSSK